MNNTKFSHPHRFGGILVASALFLSAGLLFNTYGQQSLAAPEGSSPAQNQTEEMSGLVNTPILFSPTISGRPPVGVTLIKPSQIAIGQFAGSSKVMWLGDHSGILVALYQKPIVYFSYDPKTHKFGPSESMAKRLAKADVNYELTLSPYQDFAPSPDNTQLVYGDEKGVHLFDLQTGKERLLLERGKINGHRDAPGYFAWSHDGGQIAFSVEGNERMGKQAIYFAEELYTVKVDGTDLRHVGQGFSPTWSPDNRSIVAIYGGANGGKELVRFDLQTKKRKVLRTVKLDSLSFVSYSPDGKQLAIFGGKAARDYPTLYLTDTNGKFERGLLPKYELLESGASRADW